MKLKYIIIVTIFINSLFIILFIYNRYIEYYNQKHKYKYDLEVIKSKIVKETENTKFYPCLNPTIDLSGKNVLVFYFSIETCQPCLEKICDEIERIFPDYSINENIIFFSIDLENRLRKNFLGKQITTSLKKDKQLSFDKYYTPALFILDSNNIIHNIFIPDKDNTNALINYLKKIQKEYLSKTISREV